MRELSLNILDIAQNSIKADATLVEITIAVSANEMSVQVKDNGKGMSEEFLKKVTDPFTTTRTTRKVGMGIPLFKMGAEMAGGALCLTSELGVGTIIRATYQVDHLDRAPLGEIAETIGSLILGATELDFTLIYIVDGREFLFDTREFKELFLGVSISEYEVLEYIKKHIREEILNINGGREI